jgi:predicted transcriptional regulator
VSLARDFRVEPEITIDSLLISSRGDARDDLAEQLRGVLTREPIKLSDLARAVGRDPADGTVRRALEALEKVGHAEKAGRGLWRLKPIGAVA